MLQIVEVFEKTVQGMTSPIICRADDGNSYVVKGRDALNKGLISELICARMGKAFGLPIPDFHLIEMPDLICRYDSRLRKRFCGAPCFASAYILNLQEFNRLSLQKVAPETLRDIFVFDYWVRNDDRNYTQHGGNPNLLVDPSGEQVFVIDHNLAFFQEFDSKDFLITHAGRDAWFEAERDLLRIQDYQRRMARALTDCVSLSEQIPDAWLEENGSFQGFITEVITPQLMLIENDDFWCPLQ